ncbi:MAG TPA: WGxxGxxG family protein [Longimicrobiaceae bacterium]|nr:WGxxGxxG family protein [Longimicrobiaceae bacterium]
MKKTNGIQARCRTLVAIAAGVAAFGAAPARAQSTATTGDSAYTTTTTTTQQESHGFPWGLLGLLGLAGLLGRRRPDVAPREEIHVRPAARTDDVRVHPGPAPHTTGLGTTGTGTTGTVPADTLRVRPDDPSTGRPL